MVPGWTTVVWHPGHPRTKALIPSVVRSDNWWWELLLMAESCPTIPPTVCPTSPVWLQQGCGRPRHLPQFQDNSEGHPSCVTTTLPFHSIILPNLAAFGFLQVFLLKMFSHELACKSPAQSVSWEAYLNNCSWKDRDFNRWPVISTACLRRWSSQ